MQDVIQRSDLTWREKVAFLAYRWEPVTDLGKEDFPVKHIFEPGVYVREMFIPADTIFIGRVHRLGHRIQWMSGIVELFTEEGSVVREAPFETRTRPGDQALIRTLTDVVARTYHPNLAESRDIDELELAAFHPREDVIQLGGAVDQRLKELVCLAGR